MTKMSISLHIASILKEKELDDSVVKSYLTTAADGKRYNVISTRQAERLLTGLKKKGSLVRVHTSDQAGMER